MKLLIIAALLFQQPTINQHLAKQIDAMYKEDQRWRVEFVNINAKKPSAYSAATVDSMMQYTDSVNQAAAKSIVNKYCFPGFNLVGETGSNRFWAIVQHCDDDIAFQENILKLMKPEINRNNASKENYAYLTDRVLLNKHQKQIYGTQCHLNEKTHLWEPVALRYPKRVDALRKSVGLGPLKDYLNEVNSQH